MKNITKRLVGPTIVAGVSLGAGGCGPEVYTDFNVSMHAVTEIHAWPYGKHENRPPDNFELVRVINDDSEECEYDIDDVYVCTTNYDDDYEGFLREDEPIVERTSATTTLDGTSIVIPRPPAMDPKRDTADTRYTREYYLNFLINATVDNKLSKHECSVTYDSITAETLGQIATADKIEISTFFGTRIKFIRLEDSIQLHCA